MGQRRPSDNDEKVVLFLNMKQGVTFTADLVNKVSTAIRQRMSARHIPSYIFPVPKIPASVPIDQSNCFIRI